MRDVSNSTLNDKSCLTGQCSEDGLHLQLWVEIRLSTEREPTQRERTRLARSLKEVKWRRHFLLLLLLHSWRKGEDILCSDPAPVIQHEEQSLAPGVQVQI